MDTKPEVGEPDAGPWQAELLDGLVGRLLPAAGQRPNRPWIVAVDGRIGAGETTLVERLLTRVPGSDVVHTDDVAWHFSFFDWARELRDGVLKPLRKGEAVHYRPPGWVTRERPGAIVLPAGRTVVWAEGSGASRQALSDIIDASICMQCDNLEARRRLLSRDGQEEEDLHRGVGRTRDSLPPSRPAVGAGYSDRLRKAGSGARSGDPDSNRSAGALRHETT